MPWRESGFLDNPRVPDAVRLSRERVLFTPGPVTQGCGRGCRLQYALGDDPPPEPDGANNVAPPSLPLLPTAWVITLRTRAGGW